MRTGCVVLPTFMIRKGNGTHKMIIEPPIEMKTGSEDAVGGNISAFVKRLEGYVSKYRAITSILALRTYMSASTDHLHRGIKEGITPFLFDSCAYLW